MACQYGASLEVIKVLLDKGAEVNAANKVRESIEYILYVDIK